MRRWDCLLCVALFAFGCSDQKPLESSPSPQAARPSMVVSVSASPGAPPLATATAKPGELYASDIPLPQFPGALQSGMSRMQIAGPDKSQIQVTISQSKVNDDIEAVVAYYKEQCPKLRLRESGNGKYYFIPPSVENAGDIPLQGERIEIGPARGGDGVQVRLETYVTTPHD